VTSFSWKAEQQDATVTRKLSVSLCVFVRRFVAVQCYSSGDTAWAAAWRRRRPRHRQGLALVDSGGAPAEPCRQSAQLARCRSQKLERLSDERVEWQPRLLFEVMLWMAWFLSSAGFLYELPAELS
jgi:hypothetical protein